MSILDKTTRFDKLAKNYVYVKKNISEQVNNIIEENEKKLEEEKIKYVSLKYEFEKQQQILLDQRGELEKILSGRLWKLINIYYKIRDKILKKSKRICDVKVNINTFKTKHISKKILKTEINYPSTNNPKLSEIYRYAKVNISNSINVITPTFFDFNGENYFCGGAERYLTDLYKIAKKNNSTLNIFQYGNYRWVRKYKDITVISLSSNNQIKDGSIDNQHYFSKNFYLRTNEISILNIYSPFYISHGYCSKPSIGISHGIGWDNPQNSSLSDVSKSQIGIINNSREHDELVSVDTNTPKWIQTYDYYVSQKMRYIPNYVDKRYFYPRKNFSKTSDKIIIIFARRFYQPRGFYITLDIVGEIINKHPNVEFHFVGRGYDNDVNQILLKIKQFPNNIKMYSKEPDEMPDVYRKADISLIPTLYSEGTSLSLLESIASGNAVIATRVGGLTDLIIDNFNGLLIEPNAEDLKNKILHLINNPKILKKIKKNALESSKYFSKDKWNNSWNTIFKKYIHDKNRESQKNAYIKTNPFINNDDSKINKIFELIKQNYIVFIKSEDEKYNKNFSFERIQFVKDIDRNIKYNYLEK